MRMTNGHLRPRKLASPDGEPEFQGGGSPPSMNCPDPSVWLEFAAGLRTEEAPMLLHHAAQCSLCAKELKEAINLLNAPQLDDVMQDLASATPEWQQQMAQSLAAATSTGSSAEVPAPSNVVMMPKRVWSGWRMYGSLAASIAVLALLIGFGIKTLGGKSDARLLADAYNKQRRTALRIPGGDPVVLASETRASTIGIPEPSELLELKLRAQQHLEQTPNSPYWHQVMGEIQLLEQDGAGARRSLEIAQATDEKLPDLLPDLAAAWFEIGEKTGTAETYAEAAELYSKELQAHPANPALLYYNRALCWERQNLTENALNDFRTALSLEPSPAWRKSIEAEIARLSAHSSTFTTDGYEESLANATEKLLPQWNASPQARLRITQVAALGVQHHDRWLADWIAANHSPVATEGDDYLARAVAAARTGDAESSFEEASRALDLYTQATQIPGLRRAELAKSYALQRLGRAKECLRLITTLTGSQRVVDYSWLEARSLAVQADCQEISGDFSAQQRSHEQAIAVSTKADLPVSHIRTLGEQTELAKIKGLNMVAWQMSSDALHQCHLVQCPPINEYTFLYLLVDSAQTLRLPHVAAELMDVAAQIAGKTDNAATYAYALETLGTLTGRIGDYGASTKAYQRASFIAHSGDGKPLAAVYRADWQIDRAEILSRQGMYTAALDLLQESGPTVLASGYQPGRLHYLTQLATTQRLSGQYDSALANAWKAVSEAEHDLPSLRSSIDKESWQRANELSYAELVKAYLKRGEDTHALLAWERFRTAPYRTPSAPGIVDDATPANSSNSRVLILAHIDQEYVAWVATGQPLRSISVASLGVDLPLQHTAATFYRLCSDRDSSLADIKIVGARLYSLLMQPLARQMGSPDHLWVEVDPSLAMIPFSALPLPNGAWLGTALQITLVPAWWTLHPEVSLRETVVTPDMHLVAVSGFNDSQTSNSEISELGQIFHNTTLIQGSSANAQTILTNLPSAEIFHFSGHASTASGSHTLLSATGGLTPEAIRSVHLHRCMLAVLAACNTTAADPDQLEKLPDLHNAVLLAGAGSVVASNWDVDDRSTRSLILTFYRRLATGTSPSQSLRSALESIQSSDNWQHPFYWASFEVFTN